MVRIKNYILAGITVFLLISAGQNYFQSKRIDEYKSEVKRLQDNVAQLLAQGTQQTALVLTQDEWLRVKSDSIQNLLKQLKIKPKQVTKIVTQVIREVVRDTVEVESEWLGGVTWHLTDSGKCWRIEFDAELKGLDLNTNRTLFEYNNQSTDLFYWQRKKVLGLKIGRREYFRKSVPKCGTIIEKSIEIIKK